MASFVILRQQRHVYSLVRLPTPCHSQPFQSESSDMKIVVLACGDLGIEVAHEVARVQGVDAVALVTTPYRRLPGSVLTKCRRVYRTQGLFGLVRIASEKIRSALSVRKSPPEVFGGIPSLGSVERHHFANFHDDECLSALRKLAPDLGILAGTYILRPEVFSIPTMGCVNVHSGEAPRYRGAAPAFWELYNGETHVGITIHRVTAKLDAGNIILQELFPLDPCPGVDPLEYLDRYRREVLRPNSVRLCAKRWDKSSMGRSVRRHRTIRAVTPIRRQPAAP